jgi:bifunctional oligoribonuclease and PAP phosphatase NrnA
MKLVDLSDALAVLRGANRVLITTHANPDGDAVGSMLGCKYLLEALGDAKVDCAMQDHVPGNLTWLPGVDDILLPHEIHGDYDLYVITDVAQFKRIGGVHDRIAADRTVLVLDHHLETEPCGTLNYMNHELASASEIILDLFEEAGLTPGKYAAECIYVGLVTDTGGFRYQNTTSRTHAHARMLLEAGIDVSTIASRLFDDITMGKFELTKRVLSRMVVGARGRYAYSYLLHDDLTEVGASNDDVEGLVNYARNLEGVQVGILFRELENGRTKVSMRSHNRFNSSDCLKAFGGGGHAGAAGATLDIPLKAALDSIVHAVEIELKRLG